MKVNKEEADIILNCLTFYIDEYKDFYDEKELKIIDNFINKLEKMLKEKVKNENNN